MRDFAGGIYRSTERAVTGKLIRKTSGPFDQARIKMLFDFLFSYCILLVPFFFVLMLRQDYTNLIIIGCYIAVFVSCALLMTYGASIAVTGTIAALNTLLVPMFSSFMNDLDLSPLYAIPWLMACLLGYFVVNLRTALTLGSMLFCYLAVVAFLKTRNIPIALPATYSALDKYLATPFLMAGYLIICLRVWGVYYRNISRLEQQRALEKQKQFSALINQNLTKQFLLVKGLSRSGKSEFLEGNTELLDACFSEIEKQCDTAIHYLDGSGRAE